MESNALEMSSLMKRADCFFLCDICIILFGIAEVVMDASSLHECILGIRDKAV